MTRTHSPTEASTASARWAIIALTCLLSAPSFAVAPLLASQLVSDCGSAETRSEERAGSVPARCALYLAGFLDGAVATDARVAENVASEFEHKETFTERAIRTRIGARMQRFGPSVYAEYCIGEPVPISEVIALLRKHLQNNPPQQDDLARDTVYALLREHYACPEQAVR